MPFGGSSLRRGHGGGSQKGKPVVQVIVACRSYREQACLDLPDAFKELEHAHGVVIGEEVVNAVR